VEIRRRARAEVEFQAGARRSAPKLVRDLYLKVEHKIVSMLTIFQGTKTTAHLALPQRGPATNPGVGSTTNLVFSPPAQHGRISISYRSNRRLTAGSRPSVDSPPHAQMQRVRLQLLRNLVNLFNMASFGQGERMPGAQDWCSLAKAWSE